MKCKICQENKKKKSDEFDKRRLVRMYFRDWRRFMGVLFLSVTMYAVTMFISYGDTSTFTIFFRLSLLVVILCTWFYMIHLSLRIKLGCLHFASIMLWVAPIIEFQEPVTFVVFSLMVVSLLFLFLDITLGVMFKITINPVERTWCTNREQPRRNIKKGRKGK